MKLENEIKTAKNKLIKTAKNKGLYENFGQKEVSKLYDKYINISDYSLSMNNNRALINAFDNWCMNYCG